MNLLWWRKRHLRTIWKVEKGNQNFLLVGTAHFSPYSFKESLQKIIKLVHTVAFEGPLDSESMRRVSEYGMQGEGTPSLYDALNFEVIQKINRELNSRLRPQTITTELYTNLISKSGSNFLETMTQGVRPWFGFFKIWSALLDWHYSMDLEAYNIALSLGKEIEYLETIDDQLASLDRIPFERIVNFLNQIDQWETYKKMFLNTFLLGDLEGFASMTKEFPTRCESIVTKRDPIFFERMKTLSEKGIFAAFVGVIHIPGLRKMLLEDGFNVIQQEI